MIRKILGMTWGRMVHRFRPTHTQSCTLIPAQVHRIDPAQVSKAAVRTCEVLQQAGYQAYIVGGAVRDLIAGVIPKDFDVATNASPNDVRALFRRARLIGRRFQIVHVMQGAQTIEVSTFRAAHDEHTQKDEHGRVLHDNVWGSIEDDAARRDFTINALYYDPVSHRVLDYHRGVEHLKQKRLCVIGSPRTRYREDPVRMLRAVRLSAKLGLSLDESARAPIRELAPLIAHVPAARLFDEMLKLLLSGHALASIDRLREEGLHDGLLPFLDVTLEQPLGQRFIREALADTDQRVQAQRHASASFLFATLLWPQVLSRWQTRKCAQEHPVPALLAAMDDVLSVQAEKLAITRRIASDIKEIWLLQPRFEKRAGRAPLRLIEQPRYRAAWDFLVLRGRSGEIPEELPQWWTRFMAADAALRDEMLRAQPSATPSRRRRARAPRRHAQEH
jgi:poly(A) polymerase